MKTINQKQIAVFLGVSESFLSDIKHGNKRLSPKKALYVSSLTGFSVEQLLFADGEKLYGMFIAAYSKKNKPRAKGQRR